MLLALFLVRFPKLRRFEARAYGLAAVVGAAAFFNFGIQYHQWNEGFVNQWELYHYQLGSKYFPEFGYDGLYSASLLAQRESDPDLPVGWVRDLETNLMVSPEEHEPKVREVRARFSEARWQSFVADHQNYVANAPPRFWSKIRADHGYNPTPAWTFVARLFDSRLGSSVGELRFLVSLDILLMAVMFAVVFRTYGFQAGCLGIAIAGLGFGWRHLYIGSLLRLDWLAACVIGICMLKRERFVLAGACIGYAAAVRVFPVLFLAGPGLIALRSWSAGERPRWPFQLAAGFIAVVCIGWAGGSMTGRGVAAWTEFAEDIQVHRQSWGTNQVGLDSLFVSGPSFLLANLDTPAERRTRNEVTSILTERRVGRVLAAGAMLLLLGLAVRRATLAESAVLGLAAIFALTLAVSYYWIMTIAIPFRRGTWAPLAILVLATTMYVIASFYPKMDHQPFIYAVFAWGNALILFAWLLPDAVRELRQIWQHLSG